MPQESRDLLPNRRTLETTPSQGSDNAVAQACTDSLDADNIGHRLSRRTPLCRPRKQSAVVDCRDKTMWLIANAFGPWH